jgi:predicted GIY-YIG superfamily endonuclease
MGLRREKDGRFSTFYNPSTEAIFATIGFIISIIVITPLVSTVISFILILISTIIFSQIGASIGNTYTEDSKKYAFQQGRTTTDKIVSEAELNSANLGEKGLYLCYDNNKNKYYWYIHEKFFSIKKELTQEQFMAEYKILVGRISTHVYLINQDDSNMYKIGITNSVKKRLSSIQTANPNPLSLMYSGKVNNAKKLEKELHTHFKRQKINREWFRLDPPDVKYVIRRINEDSFVTPELNEISKESLERIANYKKLKNKQTPELPADKIDRIAAEFIEDYRNEKK